MYYYLLPSLFQFQKIMASQAWWVKEQYFLFDSLFHFGTFVVVLLQFSLGILIISTVRRSPLLHLMCAIVEFLCFISQLYVTKMLE